jgi:hypothetical protein
MKRINQLLGLLSAGLVLSFSVPVTAAESGLQIPQAVKGENCVEETSFMRRNHMNLLKGHREEALRDGNRSGKYSLKECIDCHVPADNTINAVHGEGDHFCVSCHAYVAVKLDCFECHASSPETNPQGTSSSYVPADATPVVVSLKTAEANQ